MSDATDREEAVVRLARKVLVALVANKGTGLNAEEQTVDAFWIADAFYTELDNRAERLGEENNV